MITTLKSTRKPDITFYRGGRIDICSRLARQLNLEEGDVIDIASEKGEYLLFVRHKAENAIGRHEARVMAANKGTNNLRTYSRRLSDAMFKVSRGSEERIALRLAAGLPTEIAEIGIAVPLITHNPL